MLRGELGRRAARPGAAHKGRIELHSPRSASAPGLGGLQPATPFPRLGSPRPPSQGHPETGSKRRAGTILGTHPLLGATVRTVSCGATAAGKCQPHAASEPWESKACTLAADPASVSVARPAPPAGAWSPRGSLEWHSSEVPETQSRVSPHCNLAAPNFLSNGPVSCLRSAPRPPTLVNLSNEHWCNSLEQWCSNFNAYHLQALLTH